MTFNKVIHLLLRYCFSYYDLIRTNILTFLIAILYINQKLYFI